MENQQQPEPEVKPQPNTVLKSKSKENIILKGTIVIGLILVMLIPTPFILGLIAERAERQEKVITEIGGQYGSNQTLYGPFIKIPYTSIEENVNNIQYLYLAPQQLNIKGDLNSEVKRKGIYNAVLYQSKLNITADYTAEIFSQLDPQYKYNFNQAKLVFGISDINGLNEDIKYTVNSKPVSSKIGESIDMGETKQSFYNRNEGDGSKVILIEGFEAPITIPEDKKINISFPLVIKGNGDLDFLPLSKRTNVEVLTSVKDLSFYGNTSPAETVKDNAKTLKWRVFSKGKNQVLENPSEFFTNKNKFGVKVLQSFDEYSKTNRVAKYSILFIGLTFITFFFIEIINKLKIHPVQYVLVGLALSVFYLLLLSISEYIGFNNAYIIAALATIMLICWFVKGIVKNNRTMGIVFIVLLFLYTYIFVIIQLDQLALLAGSIGLFVILALLMYFSRKVEWKVD